MSPPGRPARETWDEVLARLELDLDVVESATPTELAASPLATTPFVPPVDLGPLPAGLQERAVGLQLRLAAAERRVEHSLAEVRRAMAATSRLDQRSSEPAYPRFIDAAL